MRARIAIVTALVAAAVLGGGAVIAADAATQHHVAATATTSPAATKPPVRGIRVSSARQLLKAWTAAGLPCATPKDGDTYYASGTVECGKLTILSYFGTKDQLDQQNGALNDFGKDGFLKLKVLEGPNWTVQAETKYLQAAQKALGGKLTDGAHAGK